MRHRGMNLEIWKRAAKIALANVNILLENWRIYRKTHIPTVFILGKPDTNDTRDILLCAMTEDEEPQVSEKLAEGFYPLAAIGIPNETHSPVLSYICETIIDSGLAHEFIHDAIQPVVHDFHNIVKVLPEHGLLRAWYLAPEAEQQISSMAHFQYGDPNAVKKLLAKFALWESTGLAVRDLGYQERKENWRRFVLSPVELIDVVHKAIEDAGFKMQFETFPTFSKN